MNDRYDTLAEVVRVLQRSAPEYLDLLTAQTEEQFDAAIDVLLERAIAHLERNKDNFATLNEVGLTGVLAASITTFGIAVTQEAHSNGHVDLTIELTHRSPMRRLLGEAKIYNGPAYHTGGLKQLLGRYTTGREGRGLLIVYVRERDIEHKIKAIRAKMDVELPMEQRGPTQDHPVRWWFLSTHGHSCGTDCRVGHVGCNLYIET